MKYRKSLWWILIVVVLVLNACTSANGEVPDDNGGDPPYAAFAAEQKLAEELSIPVEEIVLVSYERVEWADACLEFAEADEMCAQVITPGWRVVLEAGGQQYEFHTDLQGENLRWQKK